MSASKLLLAVSLLGLTACASAQAISYDPATGVLTIPSVSVGGDTYVNVTLRDTGNYRFELQGATAQVPAGMAVATYDAASGLLTLPTVVAGYTTYVNVVLLNVGNYTFTVQSATAQPVDPMYPPYQPS